MKSIGVLSVALAASTLLAPSMLTASADSERGVKRGAQTQFYSNRDTRHAMNYSNRSNHSIARQDRRQAVRACRSAIQFETDRAFPGPFGASSYKWRPDVIRSGKRGNKLIVSAPVRVEGKYHSVRVPSECVVRHGRVVDLYYDAYQAKRKLRNKRQNSRNRY